MRVSIMLEQCYLGRKKLAFLQQTQKKNKMRTSESEAKITLSSI